MNPEPSPQERVGCPACQHSQQQTTGISPCLSKYYTEWHSKGGWGEDNEEGRRPISRAGSPIDTLCLLQSPNQYTQSHWECLWSRWPLRSSLMPANSSTSRETNVQLPSLCRAQMRAHWQLGCASSLLEHIQKAIQTVLLFLAWRPLLWPLGPDLKP